MAHTSRRAGPGIFQTGLPEELINLIHGDFDLLLWFLELHLPVAGLRVDEGIGIAVLISQLNSCSNFVDDLKQLDVVPQIREFFDWVLLVLAL